MQGQKTKRPPDCLKAYRAGVHLTGSDQIE